MTRSPLNVARNARRHPLTRDRPAGVIARWLRWQIGGRLVTGPVAVSLIGSARMLISPGMHGATGNIFFGLVDAHEMAFALHLLRPDDTFVDVGANAGVYTVLASAVVGVRTVAIEPVPETFEVLKRNVSLNAIEDRVDARNVGAGDRAATLYFSSDEGVTNRVLTSGERRPTAVPVPVQPLDEVLAGRRPQLIKVDVEGYECPVLAGAVRSIEGPEPQALILEFAGHGRRYGFDESSLHRRLLERGFEACAYDPFTRGLEPIGGPARGGNTIYVRDRSWALQRLRGAAAFEVLGHQL